MKEVHLICNAHLDPVWLWEWQSGVAEAISTFRSAVEICESQDDFIFNHNESILYKWVKEHDPKLYGRIKKLHAQGKWHIMGGWYLQPDCNMITGESFVRQIAEGHKFFMEEFGVSPTTAINFDPFGHSRGLVQVLAKCGFDSYLFGRPEPRIADLKLPAEQFVWIGYDGSEVVATRFPGWYNTEYGKARSTLEERIQDHSDDYDPLVLLWGIGNHGGGPSRLDAKQVQEMIVETDNYEIIHSTPENYFKKLISKKAKLPEFRDSLNPWAIGCYASQMSLKQKHCELESQFYMVEKMVSMAVANGLMEYPVEEFGQASKSLLFSQFHDILPGTSIEKVENFAMDMMGHGLHILDKLKTRAFFALTSNQPQAKDGSLPVFVYNPHPYPVTKVVECTFNLRDFKPKTIFTDVKMYHDGMALVSQVERDDAACHHSEWMKKVVFCATLQPSQVTRFDMELTELSSRPLKVELEKEGLFNFRSDRLEVDVNLKTGYIDNFKVDGKGYLENGAFKLVVLEDDADPWRMRTNVYGPQIGEFKLAEQSEANVPSGIKSQQNNSVRIVEDGDVRTIVEVLLKYKTSYACQRYILPKHGTEIELETRIYWSEKDSVLKMVLPYSNPVVKLIGQDAFGYKNLDKDGIESVSQKWLATSSKDDGSGVYCVKKGVYGSDFCDGKARLTLLRSPAYSAHPGSDGNGNEVLDLPHDRFVPRVDQGQHLFRFVIGTGSGEEIVQKAENSAGVFSEQPFTQAYFTKGDGSLAVPMVIFNNKALQLTAAKYTEDQRRLIMRIFESTGSEQELDLYVPVFNLKKEVCFKPFEIKTFVVDSGNSEIFETNLVESKIDELEPA